MKSKDVAQLSSACTGRRCSALLSWFPENFDRRDSRRDFKMCKSFPFRFLYLLSYRVCFDRIRRCASSSSAPLGCRQVVAHLWCVSRCPRRCNNTTNQLRVNASSLSSQWGEHFSRSRQPEKKVHIKRKKREEKNRLPNNPSPKTDSGIQAGRDIG